MNHRTKDCEAGEMSERPDRKLKKKERFRALSWRVFVLSPRSREWESLPTDPGKVLEDVKERVRTLLEAPDGKPPALPGYSQSLTVPGVESSFRASETRPGIQKALDFCWSLSRWRSGQE